jgi:nucleoside-diphosphate-sugar epimerase
MSSAFWKSKKVLVTGGAGFVGSHLVDRLIELGAVTRVVDDLSKGSVANILEVWEKYNLKPTSSSARHRITAGDYELIKCDLEEKRAVREVMKDQDVVLHLAAPHGGRSYIDTYPADCCGAFGINHNVISEAYRTGVDRIHFSSSTCVYPVPLQSKYDSSYLLKEEDAFKDGWANCDREYGWAKLMGELEIQAFVRQYGLKASISRYCVAYGPRENDTHAVIALIRKAVEKRDPYIVWGTGEQDRDFVYVSDIVQETLLCAEKVTDGTVVNVGASQRYKIKDVANLILKITGHKPKQIIFDTSKPVGVLSRAPDTTKAKQLIGYEAKVSLEEGLRRTIEWFIEARPKSVETLE